MARTNRANETIRELEKKIRGLEAEINELKKQVIDVQYSESLETFATGSKKRKKDAVQKVHKESKGQDEALNKE